MTKPEIFMFLNTNSACHLATIDGNRPRVRGVLLYRADENGLIFHTGKMKDVHNQLTANPAVEFCFNNHQDGVQIRVSGSVELLEDLDLKKEIVAKRDFLQPWVEQSGYDPLAVYRMKKGKATIWTLTTNFAPKEYIEL